MESTLGISCIIHSLTPSCGSVKKKKSILRNYMYLAYRFVVTIIALDSRPHSCRLLGAGLHNYKEMDHHRVSNLPPPTHAVLLGFEMTINRNVLKNTSQCCIGLFNSGGNY